MSEVFEGIVLYCDGSARPVNPGNTGCGIHGYRYTTEISKKGTGLATHKLTTSGYVDNSALKPEMVFVSPIEYYDFIANAGYGESNNAAEIDAMYHGLTNITLTGVKQILILSDSEITINGINKWIGNWKSNNWIKSDGGVIANQAKWQRLDQVINQIRDRGIELIVNWVKGHSIDHGNNIADRLAGIGAISMFQGKTITDFIVSPAGGYWKSDFERHPFMSQKVMYFNSLPIHNTKGKYYLAEPGKKAEPSIISKRSPEAGFSVIELKEPIHACEEIRDYQGKVCEDLNAVVIAQMDEVYHKNIYPYLSKYGSATLIRPTKGKLGIDFIDNTPITRVIDPAGLAIRAANMFGKLEDMLDYYKAIKKGEEVPSQLNLQLIEVTDKVFDIGEKKGKLLYTLKPEYVVGFTDTKFTLEIKHKGVLRNVNIPVQLGVDMPVRNYLKRMEPMNPSIYFLSYHLSEDVFQYFFIIETEDCLGIWANYFASKMVLLD